MPEEQQSPLDEGLWPSQPTWDLICELMGQRHIEHIKAVLNARMEALGAGDLMELVAMEAVHRDTPLPERTAWDPAIVNAGITLPEPVVPDEDRVAGPLLLQWHEKKQQWEAAADFFEPDPHKRHLGYFTTIDEADAAYRALTGLDAGQVTEVLVNDDPAVRVIIDGQISVAV